MLQESILHLVLKKSHKRALQGVGSESDMKVGKEDKLRRKTDMWTSKHDTPKIGSGESLTDGPKQGGEGSARRDYLESIHGVICLQILIKIL
jgi:hypothetical protein